MTPTHTQSFGGGTAVNGDNGNVFSAYIDALTETAAEMGLFRLRQNCRSEHRTVRLRNRGWRSCRGNFPEHCRRRRQNTDPELLWTTAGKEAAVWNANLEQDLYSHLTSYPEITFSFLLPYPYIGYWLGLGEGNLLHSPDRSGNRRRRRCADRYSG